MSHSAMSTPERALPSTGPFRQYELTNADCQTSSMRVASFPIKNGLRYLSTAVSTARARCVKVAQPSPYNPGSFVCTLTTISRMLAGAVRNVFTSVMRRGGVPCAAVSAIAAGLSSAPNAPRTSQGRPIAPDPTSVDFNQWRRFIVVCSCGWGTRSVDFNPHVWTKVHPAIRRSTRDSALVYSRTCHKRECQGRSGVVKLKTKCKPSGGPAASSERPGREATRSCIIRDRFQVEGHAEGDTRRNDSQRIVSAWRGFLSLCDQAGASHTAGPPGSHFPPAIDR